MHEDDIKWQHFPRCWPFVRRIHSEFPSQRSVPRSFNIFFDLSTRRQLILKTRRLFMLEYLQLNSWDNYQPLKHSVNPPLYMRWSTNIIDRIFIAAVFYSLLSFYQLFRPLTTVEINVSTTFSMMTWVCPNRPISQISQCTCPVSHCAPLRAEVCTILFWIVPCGIKNTCIERFMKFVYSYPIFSGRKSKAIFAINRSQIKHIPWRSLLEPLPW